MSQEHYFSADPGTPVEYRDISFEIAGQTLNVLSASGTFSASKLDPGTTVLLGHFKEFPESGNVLDLGCGWGPISLSIAKLRPETNLWALDVNRRSLSLVEANARKLGLKNVHPVLDTEIPESLSFTGIWSNPPIRVGKKVLHQLLRTWLPRLAPDGVAMLVVQKQLGADSLLAWIQAEFPDLQAVRHSTDKGYRILKVTK